MKIELPLNTTYCSSPGVGTDSQRTIEHFRIQENYTDDQIINIFQAGIFYYMLVEGEIEEGTSFALCKKRI